MIRDQLRSLVVPKKRSPLVENLHEPGSSGRAMVESDVSHHAEVGQKLPAAVLDDAFFFQVFVVQLSLVAVEIDGQLVFGVVGVGVRVVEQRVQVLLAVLVRNLEYNVRGDLEGLAAKYSGH